MSKTANICLLALTLVFVLGIFAVLLAYALGGFDNKPKLKNSPLIPATGTKPTLKKGANFAAAGTSYSQCSQNNGSGCIPAGICIPTSQTSNFPIGAFITNGGTLATAQEIESEASSDAAVVSNLQNGIFNWLECDADNTGQIGLQ